MSHLQGGIGVLKFSVQVTRKETGKVEEYELTSEPMPEEQAKAIIEAQAKASTEAQS